MKKLKFILTLILLSAVWATSAQDTISQDSVIIAKLKLAHKLILTNGHQQAYQIFSECAAEGNAYAMNAIGILKQRGWGTEQDEEGSITWFEQAALAGYTKAYYNLFNIYAKALGVKQNFTNAVNYLDTMQNTEHRTKALMWLGYYHYKGFGVEQNYEKAVMYFLEAAEEDNADALYFLGLCYRNGYGVEQNEAEAQYYLSRAAELGHYYSFEELQEETSEVIPQPKRILMGSKNRSGENEKFQIPHEYHKMARQNLNDNIVGEYVGTIVMYDYSGKHIIKTSDLKILFGNTQNGKIYGRWIENDTLLTDFEAILTDSTLQFLNTEYRHTERYSKSFSKKWKFNNAVLEKTDINNVSYLVGNIQQYDMKLKEPRKPLYISLQKSKFTEKREKETDIVEFADKIEEEKGVSTFVDKAKEEKDFMVAYPNPFDSEIHILFSMEEAQNVILSVYGANGTLFDQQNLGILPEGKQNYLLTLFAPKGPYLLVLQKGNRKFSNLIIKK
ncbi:MAG: T9SS type A sorting domain-containing protein [Bacteroidales bacterium]|jgi:hypothetical protein|nr:T9SS type A sorting domain-containing protein [Bacteroidales bacterium]